MEGTQDRKNSGQSEVGSSSAGGRSYEIWENSGSILGKESEKGGNNHEIVGMDAQADKNIQGSSSDGEENVGDMQKRLQELLLSSQEPELSEEPLRINDQAQEDELLSMESIYGDNIFILDRLNGLRCFQIHIHTETWKEVSVSVNLSLPAVLKTQDHSEFSYSFKVEYLPPIILTCLLPLSYTSHCPPDFTISVQWLDCSKISALCHILDAVWNQQSGQEAIYPWVEWLHSSCLPFLGFDQEITIGPYGGFHEGDRRAISGSVSAEAQNLLDCHASIISAALA